MYLYSLTLQHATGIQKAIFGNFSAAKSQEIAVSRGKILEVYRATDQGQLELVVSEEVFGMVRCLCTFRMTGATRDLLVVGSDSGRIVFLELEQNKLHRVQMETFGRSGCRRIVPGQFLAVDPKGRALMIAAIEKQKFVYVVNRDSNTMSVSSPLEAHKSKTILFDVCGVDVGFENPLFACIEVEYREKELTGEANKVLSFYEMDLGLNHVIRKSAKPIDNSANTLIGVPGGSDGPGGVLVCCENFITYQNESVVLKCLYPRRADMNDQQTLLINSYATHKQKDLFFFLLQSELGDLYKVTLNYQDSAVHSLQVQYFDTIFPCLSLCILKTGFLFAAAEYSNHAVYQFQSIGEDDETALCTSTTQTQAYFMPRPLKNLYLLYEIESLSAISDMKVQDLAKEGNPQIYTLCGRGTRSSLRVLRHGLAVSEMAASQLPGKPNGVWCLRANFEGPSFHKYILISFLNATLVLGVADKVAEVTNSGFDTSNATIHAGLLANNCYLHVLHYGIKIIVSPDQVETWEAPGKISKATSNQKQVAITLQGGVLVYFEVDSSGKFKEVEKREMEQEVMCMSIPEISEGRVRSRFLALGCYDNTIKLLSLDPESYLRRLSTQALPACQPESLALLEMGQEAQLYLYVGLTNGTILRTVVDKITGQLSDTNSRKLGTKPVKIFPGLVASTPGILGLSSRSWAEYDYMNTHYVSPLSYYLLEHAAPFSSPQCPEAFVGISGNFLRIFAFDKLGEIFNQTILPLRYSPRKMEIEPSSQSLVVLEYDHNAFPIAKRQEIKKALDFMETEETSEREVGTPMAGEGLWACCLRIVEPTSLETTHLLEIENNEVLVSMAICNFSGYESELFLVCGGVKDMKLQPRSYSECFVWVFRISSNKLELVHKTSVEDVPLAICPYYGKVLIGVGKYLRIYELGKKKLLKKSENKVTFNNLISIVKVDGERIFASDINETMNVLTWRQEDNQIVSFADDVMGRWLTNAEVLDHDTIALVDKFENVFVSRIPAACEEDEANLSAVKFKWEAGFLNSAYYKLEHIAHFHLGDLATSIQKVKLSEYANEAMVYSTTMGSIGALLPITHKEDLEFFVHLEMYMRQESLPLLGRDHLAFRSAIAPVKNVVDGDLCEGFPKLSFDLQNVLAEQLEHRPTEILKRLEEFRNCIL